MLKRRFHLADVLALLLGPEVSWRGERAVHHLVCYITGKASIDEEPSEQMVNMARSIVVSTYPELTAVLEEELPPPEFADLWLRRRCREYGTYLWIPRLRVDQASPDESPTRDEVSEVDRD